MKILALDTSSRYLCLGIVNGGRVFEYSMDTSLLLSRVLVPTIGRALAASGMSAGEVEYYAVGLGPGSFTALRIGHAAVKAMAWAGNRKVAGISTLEVIASHPRLPEGLIVPLIDARRSMLYCGWFAKESGRVRRFAADELLGYDGFIRRLSQIQKTHRAKRVIITGDGLDACAAMVKRSFPDAVIVDKDLWYPTPQPLISLALGRISEHKTVHPFKIGPVYLHPQECQIRDHRILRKQGKR